MWKNITSTKAIKGIISFIKTKTFFYIACFIIALLLIVSYLLFFSKKQEDTKITDSFVKNQLIIKYKSDLDTNKYFQQKLTLLGVISQERLYKNTSSPTLSRYYLLKFSEKINIEDLRNKLALLEEIESTNPNYYFSTQVAPNDPSYSRLWGFRKIDMENAWSFGTGTVETKVGVVDTGVDGGHSEFNGRVVAAADCVSGNCQSSSATDNQYHGTHVAGTIGALGNNNVGVAGINWNVSFVVAKVFGSKGSGTTAAINSGIIFVADNGAKVINLSLGGAHPCTSAEQDVINYALEKGATVIVAAGNDNANAQSFSPASCNGVVTVGATGPSDERASYSNYGSIVSIAAPGGNSNGAAKTSDNTIYSTAPGDSYQNLQGTSMATPHVVGVAALLLSINPNLSPSQVKSCLVDNADSISTDRPIGPRLNAFKTLNACSGLPPITATTTTTIAGSTTTTTKPGELKKITGTVFVDVNSNGQQDSGEQGYSGAELQLLGAVGSSNATTDSQGKFEINNLQPIIYSSFRLLSPAQKDFGQVDLTPANLGGIDYTIPLPEDNLNIPNPGTKPIDTTTTTTASTTTTTTKPAVSTTTTTLVFYNCIIDPNCTSDKKTIQFCPLKCDKK